MEVAGDLQTERVGLFDRGGHQLRGHVPVQLDHVRARRSLLSNHVPDLIRRRHGYRPIESRRPVDESGAGNHPRAANLARLDLIPELDASALSGARAAYRGHSELEQHLHGLDPSLGVNMDMHVDESRKHEVARNVSSSCRVGVMEVTHAADPEDSVAVHHDDAVLARSGTGAVNQSGSFEDKKLLAHKHLGRFTARGTS